jgi:UDP-GlcNAc:undecaprenyl-phosphate GlcNAc-1-phosphate transferase
MIGAVLLALGAIIAAALSFLSARFFARQGWLPDRPVGRSSHKTPTPRTGGVAVMIGFLVPALALSLIEPGLWKFAALIACAFALGFTDDARPLPAAVKLIGQTAIAALFVFLFGAVETIPAPFIGAFALGPAAAPLTVFWIVAFMNAYNFMDGANGLAATAAIFGLSALAVAIAASGAAGAAAAAALLAAGVFGFLPLNFPKGRLFLGDGGSQSIGFALAALAVFAAQAGEGAVGALFAPTVFMPFLFDVAFTLAHRTARRRNLAEGHNEHLYQLLIRLGSPHSSVTAVYLALVALSTLTAIFAGALPPSWRFLAPAGLAALFLAPAILLYRKADAAGLFAAPARVAAPSLAKAAE